MEQERPEEALSTQVSKRTFDKLVLKKAKVNPELANIHATNLLMHGSLIAFDIMSDPSIDERTRISAFNSLIKCKQVMFTEVAKILETQAKEVTEWQNFEIGKDPENGS